MTTNFLGTRARFSAAGNFPRERLQELYRAAQSENENFGVLAAVVSCTLNDLRNEGACALPRSMRGFMPGDPVLLQNFRGLASGSLTAGLEMHLIYLIAQIDVAKRLLREYLADHKYFLTHHETDQLCHAWRGVCDHVLVVMADFDSLLGETEVDAPQIDRIRLEHSLVDAREGGTELSLNRNCSFPKWAQKRRHRRVLLNDIGRAKIGGQVRSVLITDASAGGLGLDFTEGVRKGDSIAVTLSTGRTFRGQIVWSAGTRSGLQFDEELSHNDILFSWESV